VAGRPWTGTSGVSVLAIASSSLIGMDGTVPVKLINDCVTFTELVVVTN
jgi:hypothetical protein